LKLFNPIIILFYIILFCSSCLHRLRCIAILIVAETVFCHAFSDRCSVGEKRQIAAVVHPLRCGASVSLHLLWFPLKLSSVTLSYLTCAKPLMFHNCTPCYINETFLALNVHSYVRCGPLLCLEAGINGLVVT